jgi:hypothetical protein
MKISTFSAQQFESRHNLGFCPKKYSTFKYGNKTVAREFGYELGEKFVHSTVYRELQNEFDLSLVPMVVSSAPYKFIPTASFSLKDYFVHKFNCFHALKFGKSVEDFKVFRAHSYHDDYGSMSKAARDQAITSDDFYIDAQFIQGKILVFIDDIKITGSHQTRIESLLKVNNFDGRVVFLYYAELIGEDEPQIENYLNLHVINSLRDINKIIREDEFLFNTRVVKFILNRDETEFENFIHFQSRKFNETLLHFALGNEYFKEPRYQKNFKKLVEYVNNK